MASITLSDALDRANSGEPIAPVSKREAQVCAAMAHAVNVGARQVALNLNKRQLAAQGLKVSHFPLRDLSP